MNEDPYRWDERVEAWEEVAASDAFLAIRDRIIDLAEPAGDDHVVDLGAGTGLLTLALAPRVGELVAVDISERMLERLNNAVSSNGIVNVETSVADLRELPLDDESATLVVSNYAFHHLDDAGKELALAEARRILRPGGRLVICDMMFALSFASRDRRLVAGKVAAMLKRGPAGVMRILRNAGRLIAGRWEQPATPDTWERMLIARGFEDVRIELLEDEAAVAVARRPEVVRSDARRAWDRSERTSRTLPRAADRDAAQVASFFGREARGVRFVLMAAVAVTAVAFADVLALDAVLDTFAALVIVGATAVYFTR